MKKTFIIIVLILLSKPAASQWVLDYDFNNIQISVRSISVVDSNYIWLSTIDSGLYGNLYKFVEGNRFTLNLPFQLRPGDIIAKDTSKLFLNSTIENRLFYTSNSGLNWSVSLDSTYNGSTINFAISNNNPNFIAAIRTQYQDSVESIFYRSTNGGSSWQSQILNFTIDNEAYSLAITDNNHIYIGINCNVNCTDMRYIYSTNGGTTWYTRSFPLISNNHEITSPIFKKDNMFGLTFSPGFNYYIYSTSNGGSNWSSPALYFTGGTTYVEKLINIDSTPIWICAANNKVLKTTNDGVNWSLMAIPLESDERINTMDLVKRGNKYYGYIGTFRGRIFKLTESIFPIGITPISTEIPKSYSLSQNYPNPFNPVTKIRFSLPHQGYVKLSIFDALGKEVSSLVNENLQAGVYETDFDASNIPSGVYFYRIEAVDPSTTLRVTETRKMVLLK
ncbi:MAG: T9SS type A sorting domain-containing protein [Ignavibacteria bacterium]|nr:T9SS type A sorting domain-containing protein [Ignavibacteria bacterium]